VFVYATFRNCGMRRSISSLAPSVFIGPLPNLEHLVPINSERQCVLHSDVGKCYCARAIIDFQYSQILSFVHTLRANFRQIWNSHTLQNLRDQVCLKRTYHHRVGYAQQSNFQFFDFCTVIEIKTTFSSDLPQILCKGLNVIMYNHSNWFSKAEVDFP